MKCMMPIGAGMLILAHFFILPAAEAQRSSVAEELGGADLTGKVLFERTLDKSYPVSGEDAELFVSNQFGAIRVSTWDNPVVKVEGIIRVGAENMMQAERYAQTIAIEGNHIGTRVEVRTVYPDGRPGGSIGGYGVELRITAPREISLTIENRLGDCYVRDVANDVTLDVAYGVIGLTNIGGVARVRAKGDFPLQVSGLPMGGTFFLRSSQASFSDIGGTLTVNNYLGTVTLEKLNDAADVSVTCDNGPIRLTLPEGAKPYLLVTTEFGEIESDVPLRSQTWGRTSTGEVGSDEATQRVELRTSFDSVFIHIQSLEPLVEAAQPGATDSVQQTLRSSIPISAGKTVLLDAMEGDVVLEGVEGSTEVGVEVIRFVRVADVKNAQLALEGLQWRYEDTGPELRIQTSLQEDMKALGVVEYKMNVRIRYPKSLSLQVIHSSGVSTILNAAGPVVVEQKEGEVRVIDSSDTVEVTNRTGDILIEGNLGSVLATAERGSIRSNRALGDIRLESRQGKIVIDGPRGNVFVRNTGGDIRIIALEGVFGEFDVMAVDGNISMVMPPTSDAWVSLNVDDGNLYSSFPVTGSHEKNTHTFQGRLNLATHRVVLETHHGNVTLD